MRGAHHGTELDTPVTRALRLAMLQREERRIMFNLDANMEFASEVGIDLLSNGSTF